jgi:hypothetical protein
MTHCWYKGDFPGQSAAEVSPVQHTVATIQAVVRILRTCEETSVAFRSAKVAYFRGAKGDNATLIDSPVLSMIGLVKMQSDMAHSFYPGLGGKCNREEADGSIPVSARAVFG